MNIQKPKGTNDIFGQDCYRWQYIEKTIREICENFGVNEIRTPIFEYRELFQKGVGEVTDIVQKEMFTFCDRGQREYALKPEGTAPTARAYVENKLYAQHQPTKLYYLIQAFRDERNQAGRFKQFNQFGVEIFGSYNPSCEAEVISLVFELFRKLNVKDITLKLNSLGDNECRKNYNKVLKDYLKGKISLLCSDCKSRYEKNPLRILDCKNKDCIENLKDAPTTIENLDLNCKNHFEDLKNYLDIMGIPYEIDSKIVRGLDYYTKTVFEFVCKSEKLGSQTTICGGGRYDNLINQYGGGEVGAVGFAIGMERLIMLMEEQGISFEPEKRPDIYIGFIGEDGFKKAQEIGFNLRGKGVFAVYDIIKRSVKAQLKYADKIKVKYVIVIGENELKTNKINLREMDNSTEREINLSDIETEIKF